MTTTEYGPVTDDAALTLHPNDLDVWVVVGGTAYNLTGYNPPDIRRDRDRQVIRALLRSAMNTLDASEPAKSATVGADHD